MINMRVWTLDARDFESDAAFRAAVVDELAASENISYRLGVAVVSAPIRVQMTPGGEYHTVGWRFETATVPAVGYPAPEDQGEPLEDDEPDEAGEAEVEPAAEPADVSF